MTKHQLFAIGSGVLVILYPFIIFFGLAFFDPRWISLLIIVTLGIRLIGNRVPVPFTLAFAAGLVLACGSTLLTGNELGLLLYPVLVNGLLFFLFLFSWLHPPSIIETLARIREPEMPASGIAYTRKVTLVWACFFALNGAVAAFTVSLGKEWWTLYNGLIAYLLMGVLFTIEWLVRQRVRARHHAY